MSLKGTRKVFAVAAGFSLVFVTACSGGGGSAGTGEAPGKQAAAKADEPASLVVYSNSGDSVESWNDRFGNALKQKFPNYTIKYIQKTKEVGLKELLTNGETIDLYWDSIGGFASTLADSSLQYDMTELMKARGVNFSKMEPTVADSVKLIDPAKVYGIPVFNNNMVLYYNKDVFDRFGVPYPKDGMTWTETNKLAEKLTRHDGKQYIGLSSSQTHMLLMNQLSIPFVDPAKSSPTIASDERWKQFFDTVFVGPAQAPGYKEYMEAHKNVIPYRDEFLKEKEVGMFAWLSSIIFVYPEEFKSMNWDMVSLPTFEKLPNTGSQAYPTYFTVTSMSKQKEQAMNVIEYLISEDMQKQLSRKGVMTVLKDEAIHKLYGQESAFKEKRLQAAFYNKFAAIPAKTRFESLLLTPYAKAVPKVIQTGDANTVFRATEEETAKKIAEAAK
ncbi:extracellular solute-binding protein [Paenibacillus hemerocallicola]|uniref:Extracellular solute-binding protein n=1 Tax=Paenibacillus hemerocallicola TaxID=1172614 RepID=A0A5C4T356_9BACL|nr:extracellular solute-binding protein [Paenibacillus hemerocallicola]TNJ63170.1 extracellular solute-binding protein [Paenibacillus hemerocallicola]